MTVQEVTKANTRATLKRSTDANGTDPNKSRAVDVRHSTVTTLYTIGGGFD